MKLLGWLSDLNALQTRKLPMFLSRLNETNVGRGNIGSVLGSPTAEDFEVLRVFFTAS